MKLKQQSGGVCSAVYRVSTVCTDQRSRGVPGGGELGGAGAARPPAARLGVIVSAGTHTMSDTY